MTMEFPTDGECQRFFELIEEFDVLSESKIPAAIERLDGVEAPIIIDLLRIHYSHEAEADPELTDGTRLVDRYTIIEKLGGGGMGVVYRAKQDHVQRDVALKVIHPKLVAPKLVDRFRNEIATLGKLEHPNIVHIYDADLHAWDDRKRPGTLFFTMQLVEGIPIHQYVRDKQLPIGGILELLIKVCRAVHEAHEQKVIHRDLKPDNILVSPAGEPIVLDFGLAALAGEMIGWEDQGITGFSGTPSYMAPEQYIGSGQEFGDGQSIDVYALGIIAFELLTGASPYDFPADVSRAERSRIVRDVPPRRLSEFLPDAEGLGAKVEKCLRKNPADRYWTVSGFAKALGRVLRRLSQEHRLVEAGWIPGQGNTVPGTDWNLEVKIGEGSVGEVWLAKHPVIGEKRVFKFCVSEDKVRFLKREASLFRLLKEKIGRHPNFVRLHDISLEEAPFFLAMDYIEGGDLQSWIDAQGGMDGVSMSTRIGIVAQAGMIVQSAHDAGILHRDIKPGNLLIENRGGDLKVYVADFGIGQLLNEGDGAYTRLGFTRTNLDTDASTGAGSQLYIAPEIESGHSATVRSDVYSLGVVLYQLLIGDLGRALSIDWYENIEEDLLVADLKKCLSGKAEERFPSIGQFAQNLFELENRRADKLLLEEQALRRERAAYWRGVFRTAVFAAAVIVVISGLALFGFTQAKRARIGISKAYLGEATALLRLSQPGSKAQALEIIRMAADSGFHDILAFRNLAIALLASPSVIESPDRAEMISSAVPDGATLLAWDPISGLVTYFEPESGKLHVNSTLNSALNSSLVWTECPRSARFTPFPNHLFITDGAGTLHLWNWRQGRNTAAELSAHIAPGAFSFSQIGNTIALGLRDGTLHIYKGSPVPVSLLSTGGIDPFVPFSRPASAIAFNPSGSKVAASSNESLYVMIWDPVQERLLSYPRHRSPVNTLEWANDDLLVTATEDSNIHLWDTSASSFKLDDDERHRVFREHDASVIGLAISPEENLAFSSDAGGRAIIWRLDSLSVVSEIALGNQPKVTAYGEGHVYTESREGHLRTWHTSGSRVFDEFSLQQRVSAIAFCPESRYIAAVTKGSLGIIDTMESRVVGTEGLRIGTDVAFDLSSNRLLASSGRGLLGVEWVSDGPRFDFIENPWADPGNAWFDVGSHGRQLALTSNDHLIFFPNRSNPETGSRYHPNIGTLKDIEISPSGGSLAVTGSDSRIKIYSIDDGLLNLLGQVDGDQFCFSPVDDSLAAISGSICRVFEMGEVSESGIEIDMGSAQGSVAFHPEGKFVATVFEGTLIRLNSFPDAISVAELRSPGNKPIHDLLFSPDGKQLLATAEGGRILVWSISKLRQILGDFSLGW